MCRFSHPLAAIGTMSWPNSGTNRPHRTASSGLPGPLWNHLMAETASLEASVGRDRRKLLQVQHTVEPRVIDWRAPVAVRGQKPSREASDCAAIFAGSILAIAIKQLTAHGGNQQSLLHGLEPSDGRALLEASAGQNGHRMGGVTLCT
jgi:hypothetical protein